MKNNLITYEISHVIQDYEDLNDLFQNLLSAIIILPEIEYERSNSNPAWKSLKMLNYIKIKLMDDVLTFKPGDNFNLFGLDSKIINLEIYIGATSKIFYINFTEDCYLSIKELH